MQRTYLFVPIDGWSNHSRSKGSIFITVWDLEIWEAEELLKDKQPIRSTYPPSFWSAS